MTQSSLYTVHLCTNVGILAIFLAMLLLAALKEIRLKDKTNLHGLQWSFCFPLLPAEKKTCASKDI